MKKIFIAFLLLLFGATNIYAADYYIAQTAAGNNDATSCSNAKAYSWNWTTPNVAAGDTVHLCGTITSEITINASGSSGLPITIKWESGARVSIASGSIFNPNGQSYLVFDGGTACGPGTACDTVEAANKTGYATGQTGIAENTNNGSSPLTYQSTSSTFFAGFASGMGNIEIKNLIIRNLYQHTSTSDSTDNADTGTYIIDCSSGGSGCSGNISIHDNTIHDLGNAIMFEKFTNSPTLSVYNNDFYRNNWAVENSGNGARTLNIYNNHVHDAKNWDTGDDAFHHNFLHNYMNAGGTDSIALNFYNNLSDGDWGTCCTTTTMIFSETSSVANFNIYNNVDVQSCNNNTAPAIWDQNGITGGVVANNSFIGCATTSGNVEAVLLSGTSIRLNNNVFQGYGQYIVVNAGTTFTSISNNAYGPIGEGGNSPWQWGASGENSFANWVAASGETNGYYNATTLGLNSSGVPQAGSAVIDAGTNLSTYFTTDYLGNTRQTPWDIGAYDYAADSGAPTYTLTAVSPHGTVTSSPSGISCVDNGGTCAYAFISESVTLTAVADSNYTFSGWSGTGVASGCSGTGTCVVTTSAIGTATAAYTYTGTYYLPWISK